MLLALLDLLCPRRCASCAAVGEVLCAPCARPLQAAPQQRWPTPCPPGLPAVMSVAEHAGPVRSALVAHKDRGRTDLTPVLGGALARAVATLTPGPVTLIPIPSSLRATRARGYDHAGRLARAAAAVLPTGSGVAPVLSRHRRTADQVGLGAAARAANTAGAFAVTGAWSARPSLPLVLVDDLMTTGSTLAEAARALAAVDLVPLGAAVVASRRKLHP